MPIDISDKEQLDVPLTGTQMNDAIVQAHFSKDAIANIENMQSTDSEIDNTIMLVGNILNFGCKHDTECTVELQTALDYGRDNDITMFAPDGLYWLNDEVNIECNFIGMGYNKVHFRPTNAWIEAEEAIGVVTKVKTFTDGKEAISYEATTKAIFNLDLLGDNHKVGGFLVGSGSFASTDADIELLPKITAFRGGRIDNLVTSPGGAFNRQLLFDIRINGLHTALDITGWIIALDNIFITSAKKGLVASEFNNISGSIKMENVKKPFDIFDSTQVTLNSFINEGGLTWEKSEIDRCRSFIINGVYLEGGSFDDYLFSFGARTPIDVNLDKSDMQCNNVELNGFDSVVQSVNGNQFSVFSDYCSNITISGAGSYYKDGCIKYTENTSGVDTSKVEFSRCLNTKSSTDRIKPIQYLPNNIFKYTQNGYVSGLNNTRVDVTVESLSEDGGIYPITGETMLKVTNDSDISISRRLELGLRSEEVKDYFKTGDTLAFGAWVYIPKQDYDLDTKNNNPYVSLNLSDLSNGTDFGSVDSVRFHDNWAFISGSTTFTGVDLDLITLQFWFSNGITKAIGQYFYIDSIYLVKGDVNIQHLYNGNLEKSSPFGYDNGESMTYKLTDSSSLGANYNQVNLNDKIVNTDSTEGAFKYLTSASNDRIRTAIFGVEGIPSNIPIVNNGANTIWSNNGVLTLGS